MHVVDADVDADTAADALLVPAVAEAVYIYVLKNTGSLALDNIGVSDDRLSGPTPWTTAHEKAAAGTRPAAAFSW